MIQLLHTVSCVIIECLAGLPLLSAIHDSPLRVGRRFFDLIDDSLCLIQSEFQGKYQRSRHLTPFPPRFSLIGRPVWPYSLWFEHPRFSSIYSEFQPDLIPRLAVLIVIWTSEIFLYLLRVSAWSDTSSNCTFSTLVNNSSWINPRYFSLIYDSLKLI